MQPVTHNYAHTLDRTQSEWADYTVQALFGNLIGKRAQALFGNLSGKRAHTQLIRECLVIVVSARLATLDWSWRKEWLWCPRADLHLKKLQAGITSSKIFPQNLRIWGGGCNSAGRAPDLHAADAGSIPRCDTGFFSQSHCRLSFGVCTPLCATACINVIAHVKDPVVHVRVRWIMETRNHPACIIGWVARLCRSWLSPEAATRIPHGRDPNWTMQL